MKLPVQTRAFAIYVFGPCPDGRFYVGQTENVARRFGSHSKALGECPEFHKAVRLFGLDAIPVQIVAETDIAEEADRLERLFITKFNALIPHGYNMTIGGRSTRFEPGAKLIGFTEHPLSDREMRQTAQGMADGEDSECPGIECPCCNQWNDGNYPSCKCGVAPDYSRWLLRWMAKGVMLSEVPLVDDPKLVKKWRASREADFFLLNEKRGVRGRNIATVAPVAIQKYTIRFWPYLKSAVRRHCLVKKKLPSYRLGEFRPVVQKSIELKRLNIERHLRRYRTELGPGEGNIEVFAKILGFEKEQSGKSVDTVITTFVEHGGSESEITEARRRVLFYRDVAQELPDFSFLDHNLACVTFLEDDGLAYVKFESREPIERPLREIMALSKEKRGAALRHLIDSPPTGLFVKRMTFAELHANQPQKGIGP